MYSVFTRFFSLDSVSSQLKPVHALNSFLTTKISGIITSYQADEDKLDDREDNVRILFQMEQADKSLPRSR
jgi:hypothetical protein